MAGPQQFSLRWNNYSQHIVTAFEELRTDDELTDVTLSCEGQRIKGHKMVLSACSSYFRETFKENPCQHPIIILIGVTFTDLEAVVQFMYKGEVNVSLEGLPSFLQTAKLLQIKGVHHISTTTEQGLAGILPGNQNSNSSLSQSACQSGTPDNVQQQGPPAPKRKRVNVDNYVNEVASASSGAFASSSSSTPTQPVITGSSGSNGPSTGTSTAGNSGVNNQSPMIMSTVSTAGSRSGGNSTEASPKSTRSDDSPVPGYYKNVTETAEPSEGRANQESEDFEFDEALLPAMSKSPLPSPSQHGSSSYPGQSASTETSPDQPSKSNTSLPIATGASSSCNRPEGPEASPPGDSFTPPHGLTAR